MCNNKSKNKDLKFICNGKILLFDNKQKIKDISNLCKIKILVINLNNKKDNKIEISNKIICFKCNNLALFILNEDKKISLEGCKYNHKTKDLKIKDFLENQKKESKVKCEFCGNYKSYYNDEFYISSDEKNICPICAKTKKSKEIMIEYKNKFYNCYKHYHEYISYCSKCNINLCINCEKDHENHKIISFKKIKHNERKINEIKKEVSESLTKIDLYKHKLKGLNEYFNEIIIHAVNEIEYYTKIYDIILYSLENLKNYETINNVNNFRAKK